MHEEDVMPRLRDGDYRFEQGVWETFKRKLVEDTSLTVEEAKRRKAIAEMLLAEFAVDRQINQKTPEAAWHYQHGWLYSAKDAEAPTDEDQIAPGTWTTLPEVLDVDAGPIDITDPELTTAGTDVQTMNGNVRIGLVVCGKTTTVEATPEAAARLLRDLDLV